MAARKLRRIRFFLLILVIFLSIFGIGWAIFYSPFLKIEGVEVSGTKTLDAALIQIAAEEWLSGKVLLFPKKNLLLYQPKLLDEKLKEKFPKIASIKLSFENQKHKLKIEVVERKGEGFWCIQQSNKCFLFDAEGVIFTEVEKPEGSGGLFVEDLRNILPSQGENIVSSEWILFMKLFRDEVQPDIWIASYILEPEWFENGYIKAKTTAGWQIFMNADKSLAKNSAEILKTLLKKEIGEKKVELLEYIDLRVPGRAYYKLK